MNTAYFTGQIVNEATIEKRGEYNYASIVLKVRRDFKNANGEYVYDYIPIDLWEASAFSVVENFKKGTYVEVKARISSYTTKNEDGSFNNRISIIGEKLSILPQCNNEEGFL